MDPLSIGSAVVGLIAGASRIAPMLYDFITHTLDAPKTASQILDEMNSITAALGHLQIYLTGALTSNMARRSMLSLRNIVATLTACVTTYSELELVVINSFRRDGQARQVKWAINEGHIVELVQRVQAHKLSLTLMLTILQCESTQEAENSMTRLVDMVESLVASDADMRMRMDGRGIEPARTQEVYIERGIELINTSLSSSAFESDLNTSRVYRKLRPRPSHWSLNTSQQGSMALTAFSNLTMDDVSNLSVLRLPVWSTDLSNASGYDFNEGDLIPKGSPAREPYLTQDLTQDHPDNLGHDQASINTSGTNYDHPPSERDKDFMYVEPWGMVPVSKATRARAREFIYRHHFSRNEGQSGWGRRDDSSDQVFELPAIEDDEFPMHATAYPGQEWYPYVWADD